DTGIIYGTTDAPQDISYQEMVRRQHLVTEIVAKDPAVASYAASVGGGRPVNNGKLFIGLKPRGERKVSADQVVRRLRQQIEQHVPGATMYMQVRQDLQVGGRLSRTQ